MEVLGVGLRHDRFNDAALIDGLAGHAVLDDPAADRLWLLIDERFGFLPRREFFKTVVEDAARANSFHPVVDYLAGLTWDGVERLDRWLVDYGGAEDTEYVRAVGALTLVAAVRRVRKPGCKFDEMLILENPQQGTDKSTTLKVLAVREEWYSDDLPLSADGKRVIEQTRGKWIIEASELSGMRRSEVEHVKAMLSRTSDRARLSYDRFTTEKPRQSVIIGTTNAAHYLRDTTGNRRFWPVRVKRFDLDALARERDQLWAEAAVREKADASIRLDEKLWAAAGEQQDERTIDDPWLEVVAAVIGDFDGKILNVDAWTIVQVPEDRRTQDHNGRLGSVMRHLGFERKDLRFGGEVRKGYVRGTGTDREKRIYVHKNWWTNDGVPYCSYLTAAEEEQQRLARAAQSRAGDGQ
jgi:predicted P-loop ATPase